MIKLNHLLRPNATLEANKQLLQNIDQIKENFNLYDPYIQAVLIQSVINLSASDFDKISKDYFELIKIAKDSQDEWVRRKAFEFSEYPKIKIEDDIRTSLDIAPLETLLLGNSDASKEQLDSGETIDSSQPLQMLDMDLKAPSSYQRAPISSHKVQQQQQRVQPKAAVENLSIPSVPNRPVPNYQQNNKPYLQPYEKKKEKKVKELKDLPFF